VISRTLVGSGFLRPNVAAASAVMLLAMWLSSGTMAPYAATLDSPLVLEPCHYLANIDHPQFYATFAFLDRAPSEEWAFSVVLRRLLFPLLAYPSMKVLGFMWGGLLTSMMLHLFALGVLSGFLSRRYSRTAGDFGCWLLATYPGVAYWGGMPYSYAIIVPASILAMILLFRIDESGDSKSLIRDSLLLGLTFTAYDLLPFFGTASVFLVLRKRSLRASLTNAACFLLPGGVVAAVLLWHPSIPQSNANVSVYTTIIRSYLEPGPSGWGTLLMQLPRAAWGSFLFANFLALPLGWLIVVIGWRRHHPLEKAGAALLLGVGLVFLFNNAAPPYFGWQMRGEWVARLYQPLFVVMLIGLSRIAGVSAAGRRICVAVIIINSAIVFGAATGSPASSFVYARFYRHGGDQAFRENISRFGRRPLGLCSSDHRLDKLPMKPFSRPDYMYRNREGFSTD